MHNIVESDLLSKSISFGNIKPTEHALISSTTHRHTYTKFPHVREEKDDFGREIYAATTTSVM